MLSGSAGRCNLAFDMQFFAKHHSAEVEGQANGGSQMEQILKTTLSTKQL